METDNSLNTSLDSAKKHYSSMFTLPSFKKALLAVAAVCIVGVSLLAWARFPLIGSLILGISLFAITFFADSVTNKIILKDDPIFSMRRTMVLSLVGWVFWFIFLVLGVGLSLAFGSLLWVKLCLLGFAVVVTLRFIVFNATSSAAAWRRLLSTLLQPGLCITAFLIFWASYPSVVALLLAGFALRICRANIGFIAVLPSAILN